MARAAVAVGEDDGELEGGVTTVGGDNKARRARLEKTEGIAGEGGALRWC